MAIDYFGLKKTFEKFRRNYLDYAERIKVEATKLFRDLLINVIVFGSVVKEKSVPLSDVDVAIVLDREVDEFERAKFRVLIDRIFGLHPFEIHIITREEWENWYTRFIKKYIVV